MVAAGIFQMPDGMQATALGALRGIKDVNIPTIVAFVAYWVIAVPLCYFLGVYLEQGPIGVWMGLTVGLVLASIALYWRFRHKTLRMH